MKRILFIVVFLLIGAMALPAQARSRTWMLYLTPDMTVTTATAPSGVSILVVEGGGVNRSLGSTMLQDLQFLKSDTWMVLIDDITVSQAQIDAGGDYSGTTGTLRYKESMYTDANHLNKSTTIDILAGIALSGNSKVQTQIYPASMGIMQFEWESGVTAISGITVMVRAFDWGVK